MRRTCASRISITFLAVSHPTPGRGTYIFPWGSVRALSSTSHPLSATLPVSSSATLAFLSRASCQHPRLRLARLRTKPPASCLPLPRGASRAAHAPASLHPEKGSSHGKCSFSKRGRSREPDQKGAGLELRCKFTGDLLGDGEEARRIYVVAWPRGGGRVPGQLPCLPPALEPWKAPSFPFAPSTSRILLMLISVPLLPALSPQVSPPSPSSPVLTPPPATPSQWPPYKVPPLLATPRLSRGRPACPPGHRAPARVTQWS